MYTKQVLVFSLILSAFALNAQVSQIVIEPCYEGNPLLEEVRLNYTPTTVLDYTTCREVMYTDVDNIGGMVTGIYSGYSIAISPTSNTPRGDAQAGGINCEHTYPQSKGASLEPAKSDMHHLQPARAEVNTARSNCRYNDIPDTDVVNWYINDQEEYSIPSMNIDDYSEDSGSGFWCGEFEPRESVKGNIARGIFYFYTIYKGSADAEDPNYFWNMKDILLQWHYQDPVDQAEYDRSLGIANYQSGLANPFVLDSTLARRAYCLPDAVLDDPNCFIQLPLEWLSFQAFAKNDVHLLTWSVADFMDNEVFVVEKSSNGQNFEKIGTLAQTSLSDYEWMDEAPFLGENYYRIKQIDQNGQASYSKVIVLNNDKPFSPNWTITPNPFVNDFNINWPVNAKNSAQVTVFDNLGRIVKQLTINESTHLDLMEFNAGLYLVRIDDRRNSKTIKIIKE